jgi:hypothetical protein
MKTFFTLLLFLVITSFANAQPVNLGTAANYAVLGIQGTDLSMMNYIVGGPVGICKNGSLSLSSPVTINGNVVVNTGASQSGSGIIHGVTLTNQNIAQAQTDAINAANAAAALTPTQTFTTWNSAVTVTGNGGVNVIKVGSVNLGNGDNIVLNGTAADYWIINVTGGFSLGGNASIKAGGTSTASKILINIIGTGTNIATNAGNIIEGTFLAVSRSATFRSTMGPVIIGGPSVTFQLGGTISYFATSFVAGITLPVSFAVFSAKRTGENVLLNWSTASEQNNNGFYVERLTGGGWKEVAFVFSKTRNGNSLVETFYSYKDNNPFKGVSQYRLKQVGLDGSISYSPVRMIAGESQDKGISVFPNPSNGQFFISFENDATRNISIHNAAGRLVKQCSNITEPSVLVTNLSPGFYLLKIVEVKSGNVAVAKVIVK